MTIQQLETTIRTRPYPNCYLCSTLGEALYQNLQDCLFGAPGEWNLKKCPNPECGLVWLDPMPIEEDIHKAYQNYYTHQDAGATFPTDTSWIRQVIQFLNKGYLAGRYNYYANSTSRLQKLLGLLIYFSYFRKSSLDSSVIYIPACPQGSLLDVGCGNGQFLQNMKNLGWEVKGVEIDERAVTTARKILGLDVISGTLENAQFPDNFFDVVTLRHVIEHVYDPINFLRECRRVLKPGGKLVLLTPNINSFCHKMFKQSWRGVEVPRHLMLFSLPTLEACARKAHFDTVVINSTSRSAAHIYSESKSTKEGRKEKNVIFIKIIKSESRVFQILEDIGRVFYPCGEEVYFVGLKK